MLEAILILVVLLVMACSMYILNQRQSWKRYNTILANGGLPPVSLEAYRQKLIDTHFDTYG